MIELLKTIFPLFSGPRDYQELLRKLAGFAFWQAYVATWIIRSDHAVDNVLKHLESAYIPSAVLEKLGISNLNPAGFVIALVIAFVFYLAQLHNALAKLFKIRERFDVGSILLPLASLVGVTLDSKQQVKLRSDRNRLMQAVFYRYASSAKQSTLVDKHNIIQALLAWSWFWIAEEGAVIWIASLAIGLALRDFGVTGASAVMVTFWGLVAALIYPKLDPLARAEIEQIAADPTARQAVEMEFSAL